MCIPETIGTRIDISGPSTLDRTRQLSFGGYLDLPVGFQVGLMSPESLRLKAQNKHLYSYLNMGISELNAGEIGNDGKILGDES